MTDTPWQPSHADLESLFINNAQLDRLDAYFRRFNLMRVMKMEGVEIRHSSILRWLLDPLESHGLGDRFLKAFLSEALKGESAKGRPTAIDIVQADLRDIEVRREWQNIDLFLLSRRNNWAFIIENKFHAKQRRGQLADYVRKVRSAFEPEEGKLDIKGIFLTLHGEAPEDLSFSPIRYQAVCELLPRVINLEEKTLDQNVRVFLNHYVEIIKEATGMSDERTEMEELARDLYRKHKKVLNFILQQGASDLLLARDAVFEGPWRDNAFVEAGDQPFVAFWSSRDQFSFLPRSWYKALGGPGHAWPGCEAWWAGYPVICWIQLFEGMKGAEGSVRLFAEVGPLSDMNGRKGLIEGIQAAGASFDCIRFQATAANEGKKYSKFLKDNVIAVRDVHDIEEVSRAIRALLTKFQPCFDAVAPVLGQLPSRPEERNA